MTESARAPTTSRAGAPGSTAAPAPTLFSTAAALDLERMSWRDLEATFRRGSMPDPGSLVGWEFRGINRLPLNVLPVARLVGIKKFMKGMFRTEDGRVIGYNCPVAQNALDGPWHALPSDTAPRRFGFFEVAPVDPTARDNQYLHALLLDYGKGGNGPLDPSRGLRDYLVQVDPDNPDLMLGKAYYALGPARIGGLNFFILERHRRSLTDYSVR